MNPEPTDIARAEACYARGDFRAARAAAKEIVASTEAPAADRKRAAEILAATGVDPVAIAAFLVTALLLAFLIAHYVL